MYVVWALKHLEEYIHQFIWGVTLGYSFLQKDMQYDFIVSYVRLYLLKQLNI